MKPVTRSSSASRAVRKITGTKSRLSRSRRQTSNPSMSGSWTSRTTRSGALSRADSRAVIPPAVGWQAPRLCDDAQVTDQEASTSSRRLVRIAWGSFVLLGWASVLVPALLRQVEARFGVDDAAIGVYYFVYSASYASASFAGGLLTERLGRAG